ncbi:palmitoyltransferase ZDHHC21-like [Dreissena polymorpha]|uniref:Palmitoyltransferase n=1 Tax=Dreissena polymorpha TaxID=45954 RepID=A0A9D4BLP4_DREPO|nr:palmitoyltransferase ZDHHC21-like [Dreissena polymorpha]XP_052257463.1 palmitoyltransferase ZDHHC21-like [Dreissena polymorpha]XP_052257464.1 palmitoyltransferase ZDHHC21-like [Dreissena polymorpha]KAH3697733.1 hypothetical protein DPMN_085243 [Dreissena polymorpha]
MSVQYPINDPDDHVLVNLRQTILEQAIANRVPDDTNTVRLPFIGRIHFVHDRTGVMLLSGIFAYWLYGMWSSYYVILEPHYQDGHVSLGFMIFHVFIAVLCLSSLLRVATLNPGRVPDIDPYVAQGKGWEPCKTCMRWRPPRAHHCRRCQQCVVRMDHHCPWINNCVGDGNHHVFSLLLFYSFLFSLNTFAVLMLHFWWWPKCVACNQESFPVKHGLWFSYLSFIMASTMAYFMLMQVIGHHFNLLLNLTTLDTMKIKGVDDVNLNQVHVRSCCSAYFEHFGTAKFFLWPNPCRRKRSNLGTNMIYA